MEDFELPSASAVNSRFVSQSEIDLVKSRRDEQWKAAYARLGQEPPPRPTDEVWDGRSLAERLAANKIAKQEEWEERTKLANQYRHLEEDEIVFLDSILDKQREEELKRKHEDAEEVEGFKKAVAARQNQSQASPPLVIEQSSSKVSTEATAKSKPASTQPPTIKKKTALKGVVVKKKPTKPTPAASKESSISSRLTPDAGDGPAKRRKTSDEA